MNECVWIGGTILPVLHAQEVYMYNTSITRFVDLSFVVYCMPSCELEPSTTCALWELILGDVSTLRWDFRHREMHGNA